MSGNRRIVAVICLAAVFLVAIAPAASALFCAVLVPLPELFGAVLVSQPPAPESVSPEPFPPRCPLPSRAPPA